MPSFVRHLSIDASGRLPRRGFARAVLGALAGGSLIGLAGCRTANRRAELDEVRLPARHSITADQYVLLSDFRIAWDHPLITDLNQLRHDVHDTLRLPVSDRSVVVYLFTNEPEYSAYMLSTWPDLPYRRAWFFGNSYELAVYTFWGDRVQEDLRHEFTHGLLHATLNHVPLWLDEGLAEYFEVASAGPRRIRSTVSGRLLDAARKGWKPDLARLETLEDVRDMRQADYEEAWAWVHFLLHHSPESRTAMLAWVNEIQSDATGSRLSARLEQESLNRPERLLGYLAGLNTFSTARLPDAGD